MKQFITPTYTFIPGASGVGTVNLSGIASFNIKRLVSIINQTKGSIIYATGIAQYKYTNVSSTTVTLFVDTSAMNASDNLQIIYETDTDFAVSDSTTHTKLDTLHADLTRDSNSWLPTSLHGFVDSGNSTSTPLGSNATFTGTWIDGTNFNCVALGIYADQSSATNGVKYQFSQDGSNVHHEHTYTYIADTYGSGYTVPIEFKYYRIVFVNGSVAQTSFKIISTLKQSAVFPSQYKITQPITDQTQALFTRSVIVGKTTAGGGDYINVKVNPSGAMVTATTVDSSALPTGAATSANQDSTNYYLGFIDTKMNSLLDNTSNLPANSAADQTTDIPFFNIGGISISDGFPRLIRFDDNYNVRVNDIYLNANVGTSADMAAGDDVGDYTLIALFKRLLLKIPVIGQQLGSASVSIVPAADAVFSSSIDGKTASNPPARINYTITNVSTSAYTQLEASVASLTNEIEIFDSSGQTLALAFGAAGAEVNQIYITPGGNGRIPLKIIAGTRLSIKAISNNVNVGEINVNFYN